MGVLRISGVIAVCLSAFGPAWAHGGMSFSAPSRIQSSHAQGYHAKASYRATIGINGTLDASAPYAGGEGVTEITVFSVPSDAQRYMNATGRALPASHSNILLPPANPNGDYTYIWENNGAE